MRFMSSPDEMYSSSIIKIPHVQFQPKFFACLGFELRYWTYRVGWCYQGTIVTSLMYAHKQSSLICNTPPPSQYQSRAPELRKRGWNRKCRPFAWLGDKLTSLILNIFVLSGMKNALKRQVDILKWGGLWFKMRWIMVVNKALVLNRVRCPHGISLVKPRALF